METTERNIQSFHKVIVNCIKTPAVVLKLISFGVITREDGTRIKSLYQNGHDTRASEEMLSCFYESEIPGKSKLFLVALEEEDYPHLKNLVERKDYEDVSHEHARKMIEFFCPDLTKKVNTKDLVLELGSTGVLNDGDRERIMTTFDNKGNTYAMVCLLDLMQCRVSPSQWYYDILNALTKTGNEHVVQLIEPEFLKCPSTFMPKFGPILASGGRDAYNILDEETSVMKPLASGFTKEHIIADHADVTIYSNDLGAPPSPTDNPEVLPFSSFDIRTDSYEDINTYQKELNVKPELIKQLNIGPDETSESHGADFINSNINVICSSTSKESSADKANVELDDDSDCADSDDSFDENFIPQGDDTSRSNTSNFKLENYQLELAENAVLGRNTIICAETGSGKTWVAFHIVREHLRKASNVPRKVVFMARTVILVRQQFQRFQKYLPEFPSKLISGEDDECRMLHMFMDGSFDILFFTPQILVNNLEEKTIKSLSEFSLLIFDECHHTKGNEPFKRLARKYLTEKRNGQENLPQVVGLTATIGVGKSKTEAEAVEHILRVCACLDVELLSTVERHKEKVKRKTSKIEEETILLNELAFDQGREIIINAMEETEEMLNRKVCMEPDLIDLVHNQQPKDKESQAFNKWTIDVMNEAQRKVNNPNTAREIRTCAKYLNIYNAALELNKLLTSGDVITYLAGNHRDEKDNEEKLIGAEIQLLQNVQEVQTKLLSKGRRGENPNVRILSDALRKMIDKEGKDSRAMVMVKARATCKALAAFLNRDLARVAVRASPLLGQGDRGSEEGMTGKEQEDTLHKFETGEYQILVCTSVGNEGIDIPNCNIVISYEYSGSEITRIQMKGRARKANAKTIAMGTERILARERMNAYKAYMMYRAMEQVKQMDPKVMQRRIAMIQNDEFQKYIYKVATRNMKEKMKTDGNFQILCQRCSAFVCYLSDVKQLGNDHMVVRKYFDLQIEKYPHRRPKKYHGLHKKFKMRCKSCPLDWGIIAVRDVWELYILKLQSMKFVDLRSGWVETYNCWFDVPFKIEKIVIEDIPKLLGNL